MRLHQLLDPLYFLVRRQRTPNQNQGGILLISMGGLGDTVLFSQVAERFRPLARDGEALTVLLRKDAAAMKFLLPDWLRVETVDGGRLRDPRYRYALFMKIFKAGYRLVIHTDYLRHPDLDEPLVRAAGATAAYAMAPRPSSKHDRRLAACRRYYTDWIDTGPVVQDKMVRWSRYADALTGLPRPLPRLGRQLGTSAKRLAVLQPFSAQAVKHSTPLRWARLIAAIPPDWDVRLAGHPSDLDKYPEFKALLNRPNVSFEGASFAQLAEILADARLVISVDTACLHLAALVGAPTLCLASAAYVGEILPYAPEIAPPNLTVLYGACADQGCLGSCRHPLVDGHYRCVADMDEAQALAWIKEWVTQR